MESKNELRATGDTQSTTLVYQETHTSVEQVAPAVRQDTSRVVPVSSIEIINLDGDNFVLGSVEYDWEKM